MLDHLSIQCADVATSADGNNVEAVCHAPG
jgi:hypothetical protein